MLLHETAPRGSRSDRYPLRAMEKRARRNPFRHTRSIALRLLSQAMMNEMRKAAAATHMSGFTLEDWPVQSDTTT